MRYITLFVFSVFISSISQILLKSSANKKHDNDMKEYLNLVVVIAYGIFFLSTILTTLSYRYVPLSMGPILEASGYFFVAFLGYIFLHEGIGKRKLLGLVAIIVGVIIFNL